MDEGATLRADCGRCQGLCCVSLAFDRGAWFGTDKAADEPCRHLLGDHRCAIHARRQREGFGGCVHYDCAGAGQRVTEELFAGQSWRADPALAARMFESFRTLRHVHELRLLLNAARELPLLPAEAEHRERLQSELEPAAGWTPESLADCDLATREREVHAFLRGLRERVPLNAERSRRRLPLVSPPFRVTTSGLDQR